MNDLTPQRIAEIREQWGGDLYPCSLEFHSMCDMATRTYQLEAELATARAKTHRQRRELRRLNKVLGPLWRGLAKGDDMAAETKLRLAMNAAFGRAAVRAAEIAAIDAASKP
jgi:hypothetical protein